MSYTMSRNVLKSTPWKIIILILLSFSLFCFPACNDTVTKTEPSNQTTVSSPDISKPVILYYSRSGKTRFVANVLTDQLSFETEEIKSQAVRDGFLGILTCVLDQFLDRDAQIEQLKKDIRGCNPVIIASPIWIGRLSSPARTCIKQEWMKGKDVYVFLTYNGSLSPEKEDTLKEEITSQGIELKGLYKIITKEKTEHEITREVVTQLGKSPLINKKVLPSI
jgi:flavodoxin